MNFEKARANERKGLGEEERSLARKKGRSHNQPAKGDVIPGQAQRMTEPWVSVVQVAAHLGVAKDTVYRWIESKSLPAQRVGRLWKFKLSDVDHWVMEGMAAENGTAIPNKLMSKDE